MEGVQWREWRKMKRKKNKGSPGFSGFPGPLRAFPGPWDPFGFFGSARRPWGGSGDKRSPIRTRASCRRRYASKGRGTLASMGLGLLLLVSDCDAATKRMVSKGVPGRRLKTE